MRIRSAVVPLIIGLAACGPAALPPTSASDLCAGATDPGARQKYSFEQIVPCLNTPDTVGAFVASNVGYDVEYDVRERGGNEYVPAQLVYERGIDDADGHAILQCYLLEENGWDAFVVGLSIESPLGSNVCGVRNPDGTLLILQGEGRITDPFDSLADAARYYIDKGWMQEAGTLRTLRASQVTGLTTDATSPSVLQLPWVTQEY